MKEMKCAKYMNVLSLYPHQVSNYLSAIADLAVCIRMRNFPVHLPRHVRDEIIAIDLDPADRRSPELLVLHWLVEHKEETVGYRQLSFCLAAAVHQRRALGFPEHYVFGAAHVEAGEITTYAATWSQSYSQVLVYRLETYSLEKPAHAASFFLFMRCVAKKALEYQAQLAKKEKKSLPPFAPEYQTWKAPPPPPVPLPSDCGSQKRKRSDDDIGSVYNSVSEHGDFMQDERLWSQEVA
ncbi:hypothetical protein BS47DRAFT_844289 [Hydnum rufescens UP504]|uniref:Uncharacterized protein n=1 Tax=Hydnum rufescens UP504 TaxID=1448309 RepID=A0A9P6AC47_9AGAM|nr:hypothetical protein BS47DRAFT_844289 [Hydnum rufescens UP504]